MIDAISRHSTYAAVLEVIGMSGRFPNTTNVVVFWRDILC